MTEFTFDIDDNFGDHIIEERGNTFTALRKIRWGSQSDYKLDLRKYIATSEGEQMRKGCSITEDGANELTKVLLETGYGKATDIAQSIESNRKDILAVLSEYIGSLSDDELKEIERHYPDDEDIDTDEYCDLHEVI